MVNFWLAMAVAELPFDLVEAKLSAPSIRPGIVAKQDVIKRLQASPLPFATVIAPAGYGKTTLLARWAETDPRALLRLVSARQADAMPPIQDQIAKASSSNATAIRWFTGSSTASS